MKKILKILSIITLAYSFYAELYAQNISQAQEMLYPNYNHDSQKYGLANIEGKTIVPCIYEYAAVVSPLMYVVANKEHKLAFFSNTGQQLTSFKYKKFDGIQDGLIAVLGMNDKCGFINEQGVEVIPCKYHKARSFTDGFAAVQRVNISAGAKYDIMKQEWLPSWGYINKNDVDLFDCSYERAAPFCEGMAAVQINGKNGFINTYGELVVANIYDKVYSFLNGRAPVYKNGKWGFVDNKGNEVVPCIYEEVYDFNEDGIARVKLVEKWIYINTIGENIFREEYDEAYPFYEGYARVKKDGNSYFINSHGQIALLIKKEYNKFSIGVQEGLIMVENKEGRWSYIDIDGNNVFKKTFDDIFGFEDGVSIIKQSNKFGAIDLNGDMIVPCIYNTEEDPMLKFKIFQYKNLIDVDRNIPISQKIQNNTYVSIIANEEYESPGVSCVKFAKQDAIIFKEYCIKTLGIPEHNIKYKENATLNNIRSQINWLKDIAVANNGEAKVIFYYAGHGIPDETTNSSYLLPIDGIGNDPRSAYSLNELYAQLGELPAKQVTVFMDACFSGAKRDGKMLTSARGVAIRAKSGTPKGNMVVFSAAQGDETAYQYNKKKHGMFTYFLLKKLQETKGEVTLEELGGYLKQQVQRTSMKENNKLQTPTMQVSPDLKESIKSIHL